MKSHRRQLKIVFLWLGCSIFFMQMLLYFQSRRSIAQDAEQYNPREIFTYSRQASFELSGIKALTRQSWYHTPSRRRKETTRVAVG
jgi:hypothetical protein